jgi:hypothetical protein
MSTRCASKPTAIRILLDVIRILTANLVKRVRKPAERQLNLFHPSVCLYEWNNSRTDERILIKYDTGDF